MTTEKIIATPENKLKWWGEGEWVNEPDSHYFTYKNHECKVLRIMALEGHNNDHMFGGYLCGYVKVSAELDADSLDVHGGITFDQEDLEKNRWVGFHCANSHDYLPSTEYLFKTIPDMIKIREESKELFKSVGLDYHTSPVNQKSYKNMDFCIEQCKSLVDQIIKAEGLN